MKSVEFFVDGGRYVWCVTDSNKIGFCLEDSNYKVNLVPQWVASWDWEDAGIVRSFDVTGICKSPVRLVREVARITIEWVKAEKPAYFSFQTDDPKKIRIYGRLIEKYRADLADYQVVVEDGNFWAYREVRK